MGLSFIFHNSYFTRMVCSRMILRTCALVWSTGVFTMFVSTASAGDSDNAKALQAMIERLQPLHTKLGKPQPGDWLDVHHEPGQTFKQYIRSRPAIPQGKRRVIYIQPLGDLTPTHRKIISATAEFMESFFGLPVKTRDGLPASTVPAQARRRHPEWGMEQILTTYVLDKVLKPQLPDDAAAYIALTATDLWPGRGWNFVFGQASIVDRVGAWSLARNGDPDESEDAYRLCLVRTLKTATHETAHMFSMLHCTAYECDMTGSNNREESDRRPLWLCPECMAKVCWATKTNPVQRYRKLAQLCREYGLTREAAFYEESAKTLEPPQAASRDQQGP